MACATLKRSWEFDPVHSPGRPNKRPRCTPMCVSPTSSSPPPAKKSAFDGPKMTPVNIDCSCVGCGCKLPKYKSGSSGAATSSRGGSTESIGDMRSRRRNGTAMLVYSINMEKCYKQDEMAASIRFEIERLKRRRAQGGEQGHMNMSPSHSEGSNSDSDGMPMSPEPQGDVCSGDNTQRRKSLFTYKQVQRICARVVKEREDQLRQEYDEILNNKLHEQYETFIKFSRDQIQRHFSPESTPSYLS